jgi:hypothetical protein
MEEGRLTLSEQLLSRIERRSGVDVPDTTSSTEADERVQVNISKYVVEKLIKGWLGKGTQKGTIKDVCEKSVRLWLTIYANVQKDGDTLLFSKSQTGKDLEDLAGLLNADLGAAKSETYKQAYIVRIGAQIAVSLLKAPCVADADDDLLHEILSAARRAHRLVGEEVVERLRLAARLLDADGAMTVRELRGERGTGGQ